MRSAPGRGSSVGPGHGSSYRKLQVAEGCFTLLKIQIHSRSSSQFKLSKVSGWEGWLASISSSGEIQLQSGSEATD